MPIILTGDRVAYEQLLIGNAFPDQYWLAFVGIRNVALRQHLRIEKTRSTFYQTLCGIYSISYRIGPLNITPAIVGTIFMATGMGLLDAAELKSNTSSYGASQQAQDSIGRLQTFEATGQEMKAGDSERDRDIEKMLPHFRTIRGGDSDRNLKEQAVNRLNNVRLTSSGRASANKMIEEMSLYRRLPEIRFEIDPETYDYFIGNPDFVVGLWQSMGISAINLKESAKYQYDMNNVDGTKCKIYYIKRSQNTNIVFCQGEFQSPFLKTPITANGLVCINAQFEKQPDGTTFVRHSADVFVSFPNVAIEAAARLISPVSNYIADRNFQEISLFMHSMHLSMTRQPRWVQDVAGKLNGVMPDRVAELNRITLKVYEAEQDRLALQFDERELPLPIK
ncbi:hypothetical protein [Rubinisphaera sp.]|uniref:hypothetical protein n=1 Tax=Rubinisphaera sp. TaxID=2024857 RepID=UPI000C0E45D4|nr:hypothetical protein [Rubinisphaera sp.]MBV12384.1 hypothetical protein [Rubinisphaera sp.]HCS50556.1 hypothetical protein [Planctomycetaceae bacterium]